MKAIDDGNGGIYFLDAPGGTGKKFLMSLVLANVRARFNIALAVASSGIAATLLEGCRMAHSALKLPLNLQTIEEPKCNISKKLCNVQSFISIENNLIGRMHNGA
uniref:ATP-dependent DNA helicase n=1 Tax=Clastoptera arizonana TaxID=38151 RepID=A0A1B6CRH2_9HEMI